MRYLLDTCIMLYMLNKTGEMSDDVEAIVSDYGNRLYDGKFDFYCKQGLNFIFNKK